MKELIRGAILSQNHWRNQGVAKGIRAPLIKMPLMTKICQKKTLFFHFQFSFSTFGSTGGLGAPPYFNFFLPI